MVLYLAVESNTVQRLILIRRSFFSSFPTIYWVKKGDKPVSYNGGREVDDFVKYIAKHATSELKGFDRSGKAKKTEL